jgi:hypothetical protein
LGPVGAGSMTSSPSRTPDVAPTQTATDYPCWHPSRIPKVFPSSFLPVVTILEMVLRGASVSENVTVPFAADWKANFSLGSIIPAALVTTSLVVNPEEAPNPSGLRRYAPNVSLKLTSDHTFILIVPQAPLGYAIDADEEALVSVHPHYFRFCPPVVDIPLFRILFKAQVDLVAVATRQAVAAVTGTALTVSTSSAGSAMDAQSIAVIALMSCAPTSGREIMKHNRLLAPLAVGDSYEAMVMGNMTLVFLFLGLHGVLVLAWIRLRHRPRLQSFAQFYFPGFSVGILMMTYQGTAIGALKIVASATPTSRVSYAIAAIGILMTLATPLGLVIMYRSLVHATYDLYDYENAPANRRFPILRYLFPQGRWNPVEVRRCFGPLFSSLRLNHILWTTLPLWSPSVMVVGAVFRPPSARACQIEFASLAAFQFGLALFHLAARPFRSAFSNVASGASSFCLGMILAASAVLAMEPLDAAANSLMFAFIQLQMALTLFRLAHRLIIYILEPTLLRTVPLRCAHERIGTVSMRRLQGMESDDGKGDSEDGEEMSQLQTPILVAMSTPSDDALTHSSVELLPHCKTANRGNTQTFVLMPESLGDDMKRVMEQAAEEVHTHASATTIEEGKCLLTELQFNLLAAEAEANAPAGVRRDEESYPSGHHLNVLARLRCESIDDFHEEYDALTARHHRPRAHASREREASVPCPLATGAPRSSHPIVTPPGGFANDELEVNII